MLSTLLLVNYSDSGTRLHHEIYFVVGCSDADFWQDIPVYIPTIQHYIISIAAKMNTLYVSQIYFHQWHQIDNINFNQFDGES